MLRVLISVGFFVSFSAQANEEFDRLKPQSVTVKQEAQVKNQKPIDPLFAEYTNIDGKLYVFDKRDPKNTLRLNASVDYDGAMAATQKYLIEQRAKQEVATNGVVQQPISAKRLPSMPGSFGASRLPSLPSKMKQAVGPAGTVVDHRAVQEAAPNPFAK